MALSGSMKPGMSIAALVAALAPDSQLPYVTRAELYLAATDIGASEISYLLLEGESAPLTAVPDDPRAIAPRGEALPLGARKSAARTRDRQTLSHLIHDPSPQVVEIVLSNPDLRESEVLTMASKRPTSEISLQLIAGHPRWSQVRRIRLAIALNESCPLPLACRLCLDLRDQDLSEIRSSASLSPQLRGHAERLLHAPAPALEPVGEVGLVFRGLGVMQDLVGSQHPAVGEILQHRGDPLRIAARLGRVLHHREVRLRQRSGTAVEVDDDDSAQQRKSRRRFREVRFQFQREGVSDIWPAS